MDNILKQAQHHLISRLQRISFDAKDVKKLQIFQNESGVGVHFIVKTSTGKYHEIYLQPINLEVDRGIKIPKQDLGDAKDNLWVALVLFIKDKEPFIYLIPSKIVATPDNHIFFDNHNKRFEYMSNWEIKVFTNAIEYLSQFSLEYMIDKL